MSSQIQSKSIHFAHLKPPGALNVQPNLLKQSKPIKYSKTNERDPD